MSLTSIDLGSGSCGYTRPPENVLIQLLLLTATYHLHDDNALHISISIGDLPEGIRKGRPPNGNRPYRSLSLYVPSLSPLRVVGVDTDASFLAPKRGCKEMLRREGLEPTTSGAFAPYPRAIRASRDGADQDPAHCSTDLTTPVWANRFLQVTTGALPIELPAHKDSDFKERYLMARVTFHQPGPRSSVRVRTKVALPKGSKKSLWG